MLLLRRLMLRARRDGYRAIEGLVLADNQPMLALARRLGFAVLPVEGDATVCTARRALWRAQRKAVARRPTRPMRSRRGR
ncbi:MAG: hypothetical protein AB1768_20995, partial [Pseudomonadota bacterium]